MSDHFFCYRIVFTKPVREQAVNLAREIWSIRQKKTKEIRKQQRYGKNTENYQR